MKRTLSQNLIFLFCGVCLFITCRLNAQSYSFTPGKVYTITLDTNQNDFGGIEVLNTGTQDLNLTWRLVSKDTLLDSRFELCNSGICHLDLPMSGAMPTIASGDIGWLKFHMYTGDVTGTNTIKYVLKNGSIQSDTLTFIINVSHTSSIHNLETKQPYVTLFPNPAVNTTTLNVNSATESEASFTILNNIGNVIHQDTLFLSSGNNKVDLDTKHFSAGIYYVVISTQNGAITQKLSVIK